ncbi:MAG: PAS domain-containing protein [Rhodanobacter sp.]
MATEHPGFLSGGGLMGELMRRRDWRSFPIGEPAQWPDALKSVVSLMLASRFPMFLLWGDQHLCLYNDGYIALLGKRHPDALGEPFQATWPEIWSSIHPFILSAYADESLYVESLPFQVERNQFQEEASFTFSYSPLRDLDGTIKGVFCACMETTEQLRAEAKLRESEARWRGLFNNMQEGFFLGQALRDGNGHMVDFRFLEMNPGFEQQSGIVAADAIGRPVREVLPGIQEDLLQIYARVVDSGEPQHFEVYIPVAGNRWFEVRARRTSIDQFAVLFLDVTARRSVETALRKSEATFRGLAQAVPNQVWTASADGMLDWVNERTVDFSGIDVDQLHGNGWTRMVHPDDLLSAGQEWAQALDAGTPYQFEFRLRRSDESYRWHLARAIPIRDEDGNIDHWIGTNTDIDDQKHNEEELSRLNESLESRVAARGAELEQANAALRQAQKMEAVGQLTGGIAHDFNNLLTGMISGVDMLRTRLAQGRHDDIDRYIDAVATSAERAATLTHRLLAFSRRQPLKPEVVDVNARVDLLRELFDRTLGPSIELDIAATPELWRTSCDANQLESTLLNLIINARDAMREGGVLGIRTSNNARDAMREGGVLGIRTSNMVITEQEAASELGLAAGDYVEICVTDNGAGMTAAIASKVFEPFFTTKPLGEGTGLGLSMSYGFAKQSHGHIRIESEPGSGTRVMLYLPRYSGTDSTAAANATSGEPPVPMSAKARTVLVVEDESVIRELILEVLQDKGWRCLQAADGNGALAQIQLHADIDLLITDVGLPGINGRILAEQARRVLPKLRVLFVTGYAENSTFDLANSHHEMEMLTKPFGVNDLLRAVDGLLLP